MGKNKERIYLFLIIAFLIGSCFFVYKTYEAFNNGNFAECSDKPRSVHVRIILRPPDRLRFPSVAQ